MTEQNMNSIWFEVKYPNAFSDSYIIYIHSQNLKINVLFILSKFNYDKLMISNNILVVFKQGI